MPLDACKHLGKRQRLFAIIDGDVGEFAPRNRRRRRAAWRCLEFFRGRRQWIGHQLQRLSGHRRLNRLRMRSRQNAGQHCVSQPFGVGAGRWLGKQRPLFGAKTVGCRQSQGKGREGTEHQPVVPHLTLILGALGPLVMGGTSGGKPLSRRQSS